MPENAMQCWGYAYAGEYSCFHHVHPLKQADSEEMKNFLEQFCNRKSIDNKMVTGYTEFALRKMRIIKAVYFIIRSPVWSLRPDRRVTGEQSQKQYDNNDPPLKNSERSNFLGD